MKKMMRSTFGRLFNKNWVLAATLICSANVFTACVGSNDNPLPTPDETQPNLQGDFQQLINHHSISDLLWSAGKPCKTLDITDCISTDKIFLLEYDEHGKATGRYNLFALPTRTK